jgi:multidrug efflux system membrane fusion protein
VARALKEAQGGGAGGGASRNLERIPVQMGTAATADTPFEGKLQLVDNQVDAKSGTVRARAVFDNKDGQLIPGQFARIRMGQATAAKALLINERAVGTDQNKKFVMVVGADNKAAYREVTLGASSNGLRIVKAGLQANERIVVNGLQRIRPGALVAPQTVDMSAKAELAKPAVVADAAKS